ncbi:hypothetical protein MCAMS1_00173 [biofilm metagenome]
MIQLICRNLFLLIALLCIAPVIDAKENSVLSPDEMEFEAVKLVDDSVLDEMRGGFTTLDGVTVNIGVGKAIFIDGVLQQQYSFNVDKVNLNGTMVPVNGMPNIGESVTTILQNNLDNKQIQNFTVIDVAVRNLPPNFNQQALESTRDVQDMRAIQDMQILK